MIHGAGLLLIEGPLQNLDGVAMCGPTGKPSAQTLPPEIGRRDRDR